MSITGATTDPLMMSSTTAQPITFSDTTSSDTTKTPVTSQAPPDEDFPKIVGSVVMIFLAIVGSVAASWFARKVCPDSWTGKYCHCCRDYFASFKGRKRRKSAIVLPIDEDSGSTIRWTVGDGGPLGSVPAPPRADPPKAKQALHKTPGVTKNGFQGRGGSIGHAKKPTVPTRAKGKPSFMTIGSLVSTFTVPKSDLNEIALQQLQEEKKPNKTKKMEDGKTSTEDEDVNGLKSDTSSDHLEEDTNSKEMLIRESPSTDQEEIKPGKKGKKGKQEKKIAKAKEDEEFEGEQDKTREGAEVINLREISKLESPSQKSETYSSDFESMTTARTVESLPSPIRTIHEDFKT